MPAADAGTVALGDLTVNRMGFGAMRVTGRGIWGDPPDAGVAKAVLRKAVDLGVNCFDTADSYGPETSERLIAETLHPYPDGFVVMTKGGLLRPGPGRWEPECSPAHLRQACEGSLKRLKVDRIDVYQLHTVDPKVPFEDSLGALAGLRQEGKIRHIGLSNVSADQLAFAREHVPVVSVQNRYSVGDRESEPVLDACEDAGLAFIPWFPLGAGNLAAGDGPLAALAKAHDATPAQLALAWLLARSEAMLVIPGTGSVDHLEENVAAASLELPEDALMEIEAAGADAA